MIGCWITVSYGPQSQFNTKVSLFQLDGGLIFADNGDIIPVSHQVYESQ